MKSKVGILNLLVLNLNCSCLPSTDYLIEMSNLKNSINICQCILIVESASIIDLYNDKD